jgi:uncharacterized protein (DUF885 family)
LRFEGGAVAHAFDVDGELNAIRALRAHAAAELGDRFDVRAFHDELLGQGALPLDILDARMRAWVERQRRPKV